jgi:nicotinamide-nucleotide amidase
VLTPEAAAQLAEGAARLLRADVTVATTGVAGDQEHEGTPPGTVSIATHVDGTVRATVHHFDGSPPEVCDQARHQALLDLVEALGDSPPA